MGIAIVVAVGTGMLAFTLRPDNTAACQKAAIIDQQYSSLANPEFIAQATGYLTDFGFTVDVYQGKDVTVDLYRWLPEHEYQMIILRVHSGLRLDKEESNYGTWLFTDEPYSDSRYVAEQLPGKIAKASIEEDSSLIFAVGPKFITQSMRGKLKNTVILMMGCGPMYIDDMVQAWITKGASVCIGWDERTSVDYCDYATLELVSKLLEQETTVNQAVTGVMTEIGPGKLYNAELQFFPLQSADKNVRQLLGWQFD